MTISIDSIIELEQKFIWFVLVLIVLYFWSTHTYGYWSSLGVPYKKPVPLFGNIFKVACNAVTNFEIQQELYNYFKDVPFLGTYTFLTPKLMLRDPTLIEHVMVKDFSAFMDRGPGLDPEKNPTATHLVALTGPKWRSLRSKLTPVFTSGKMKGMLEQVEECAKRLVVHLEKESQKGKPLEVKYEMSGFTLEVIGSCAFGLEFNTLDDPNHNFRQIGERAFAPTRANGIWRYLRERWPQVLVYFNKVTRLTSGSSTKYFNDALTKTIKYREENNVRRSDFVQLLMEISKHDQGKIPNESEILMTEGVMQANSLVFLLAGYETTASTLSFMLYELAGNEDVQDRLYREVSKVLKKNSGQLTWESIKDMHYLEQVISETLRKYPPASELRRIALRPYTIPKSNLEIPAGTLVSIPVYSLHHDPKYYPEPEKFNPERFSETNKSKLVKFTYLPFGDGPRICIGMRFALMEIKIATARLIKDFRVKINPKTTTPLKFDPGTLLTAPMGGIWLEFNKRRDDI